MVRITTGHAPRYKMEIAGYNEYLSNKKELAKLRKEYGIFIPDFDIVVGGPTETPNVTYYTIVDRIEGEDLQRIKFSPEQIEDAALKIDKCFSGVARYLHDVTKKDGLYICDITTGFGRHEGSGNEQYMYGSKLGEKEKQLYLTDLGPALDYYSIANNGSHTMFYENVVPNLYTMIKMMEEKLSGKKLKEARKSLLALAVSVPSSNRYFDKMNDLAQEITEK